MEQVPVTPNTPVPTGSDGANTSNASSQAQPQPVYAWAWRAAFGVLSAVAITLLYGVGAYACVPFGGVGKVESVGNQAAFDALIGSWVHAPTCVPATIIDQLTAGISRDYKAIIAYVAADPTLSFGDMGQAIRRCRSDFGTEIELQSDAFSSPAKDENRDDIGKRDNVHVVTGTIRYADAHLEQLGYAPGNEMESARRGTIYWVKPVVRPGDTIDVRQYKLHNGAFPQQTTADQWFDEGQFESYRQLGMLSAAALTKAMAPS